MTREVVLISGDGDRVTLACGGDPAWPQLRASHLGSMASHTLDLRPLPSGGSRVEQVRFEARDLAVPVLISGGTEAEVDARVGALGRMLRPDRDLRLRYRRDVGSAAVREITVRYAGGGDDIEIAHARTRHVPVRLRFTAPDPWWVDVADQPTDRVTSTVFADGIGAGVNTVTVTNRGDVDVWPVITIRGQVENVELMNITAGRTVRLVRVLPVGETVRVDTNPAAFQLLLNNWPHYHIVIDPTSVWWPLRPGLNRLLIRGVTNGGAGTFALEWRPRFQQC